MLLCYHNRTMEYLTPEKKIELEVELQHLMTVRRKEVADSLEYAKSLGDLSENAEYHQAREDQATCEDRITHLQEVLKNVVLTSTSHSKKIHVGSTVVVKKKGEKETREYSIVGGEEADALTGKVSNESPLGSALLGKDKGDEVLVSAPKGDFIYTIISFK